jgi:predicted nucleic acid-binding protein
MIVVADASVLVAELLRRRGRDLLRHPELSVVVAQDQWEEAEHEISRRLGILKARAGLSDERRDHLEGEIRGLIDQKVVEVVPRDTYEALRETALRRVPRDDRDWPTVALAMALGAAILTADSDFLGCGCATWTVETLTAELASA